MHKVVAPWERIHFIGIGGVGMAGLAHILLDFGVTVSGTDAKNSDYLDALKIRSPYISTIASNELIDAAEIVVISSAISEKHPELTYAKSLAKKIMKRGEFLAEIAKLFPYVVGVAGSHGKTTTSAMLTYTLQACGLNPGWMVGGSIDGFTRNGGIGNGQILVTEVDESDGTQALMSCSHAIITNVDDDHSWFFNGFDGLLECFKTFAKRSKKLWTIDEGLNREYFENLEIDSVAFLNTDNVEYSSKLDLKVKGEFNKKNAALAIAVAQDLGLSMNDAVRAISEFRGVQRRMTTRYCSPDNCFIVIEDYAHHPTEVNAFITTVKQNYPAYKTVAIFQPHRFERIKLFAKDFGKELSKCDNAILISPFSAWKDGPNEDPEATPQAVFDQIHTTRGFYTDDLKKFDKYLTQNKCINPEVPTIYLIIGAGDITQVTPCTVDALKLAYIEHKLKYLSANGVRCEFSREKSWSQLTTAGIGKGKPWIANVERIEDLELICSLATTINLPIRVLGNGSNIIGTDEETDCLWIKLTGETFTSIKVLDNKIIAGAGVTLKKLITTMVENDCCPPDFAALALIPAKIGGAFFQNAGCHNAKISDCIKNFCGILSNGDTWIQNSNELNWEYRNVGGLNPGFILTSVVFNKGPSGQQDLATQIFEESYDYRKNKQPNGRNAGCLFKNPTTEISAGKLIDDCGYKGFQEGQCFVSDIHANFIMAKPEAPSIEFVNFALKIQLEVFKKTGFIIEPEVEFIGNEEKKLLEIQLQRLLEEQESRK